MPEREHGHEIEISMPSQEEEEQQQEAENTGSNKAKEEESRDHKEWLDSIFKEEEEEGVETQRTRIPRVPEKMLLGDVNGRRRKSFFEPTVVVIGPYHHSKKLDHMEASKRQIVKLLFEYWSKDLELVFKTVLTEIENFKECYAADATFSYDDERFAQMMVEDGCFVLAFLLQSGRFAFTNPISSALSGLIRRDQSESILQDFLLLENQIPFRVLEILAEKLPLLKSYLRRLIQDFFERLYFKVPFMCFENNSEVEGGEHLLEVLWKMNILGGKNCLQVMSNTSELMKYFGRRANASELAAAGIRIKSTSLAQGAKFTSHLLLFNRLNIPPLTLSEYTRPILMNLIAYEMCPGVTTDFPVTSYLCLLNSLIAGIDDVYKLRLAGVLDHTLGNDEQVVSLFLEIEKAMPAMPAMPAMEPHLWIRKSPVPQGMFRRKLKVRFALWMDSLRFEKPWTILAAIAAVIALVLSGIQTYYQVYNFK